MPDGPQAAAAGLDRRLRHARFRTVVHGDAKPGELLAESTRRVAAVDFQYVGADCGVQDLAYFISSCFDDEECERLRPTVTSPTLSDELRVLGRSVDSAALETEWRELYPMAWADFARFLKGWSPGTTSSTATANALRRAAHISIGNREADRSRPRRARSRCRRCRNRGRRPHRRLPSDRGHPQGQRCEPCLADRHRDRPAGRGGHHRWLRPATRHFAGRGTSR